MAFLALLMAVLFMQSQRGTGPETPWEDICLSPTPPIYRNRPKLVKHFPIRLVTHGPQEAKRIRAPCSCAQAFCIDGRPFPEQVAGPGRP
jgi:hypothetical protein